MNTTQAIIDGTNDAAVQSAVVTLLNAQAYLETVRSIIIPKKNAILKDFMYKVAEKHERRQIGEYITDEKHAYLMSDEDFKHYMKACHAMYLEEGFNVKFEYCPVLIAESLERDAKKALIDIFEPYTGLSHHKLICSGLKNFNNYVEYITILTTPKIKDFNLVTVNN